MALGPYSPETLKPEGLIASGPRGLIALGPPGPNYIFPQLSGSCKTKTEEYKDLQTILE